MNQNLLIGFGCAAGLLGLLGWLWRTRTNQAAGPRWRQFFAALQFTGAGPQRIDKFLVLLQLGGLFWIVAGAAFQLAGGLVPPASLPTLVSLVYFAPILGLAALMARRPG